MQRIPVESSNIAAIGYDPNSRVLEVEFKGRAGANATYSYQAVEPSDYTALMESESKGHYLNANIKGRYTASKVG